MRDYCQRTSSFIQFIFFFISASFSVSISFFFFICLLILFSLFLHAFLYLSLLLALFVCESALSEEVLAATFPKITLVVLEIEKVQNKTLFHHDKNKDLLQIV